MLLLAAIRVVMGAIVADRSSEREKRSTESVDRFGEATMCYSSEYHLQEWYFKVMIYFFE